MRLFGLIIFGLLVYFCGLCKAMDISMILIVLVCVVIVVGFFIGFVLPSHLWRGV